MPKAAETFRVFFALWPGGELATHIDKATTNALMDCHGRKIPSQNFHITLVFIGSVDLDTLGCLQQAAGQLSEAAFELNLDRLGYWSRPKILWLAPSVIPTALLDLQAHLSQVLAAKCGYQPETRAFSPHLSLMRKVHRGPDRVEVPAVGWSCRSFSLIRSISQPHGVAYEVLNHWSLSD